MPRKLICETDVIALLYIMRVTSMGINYVGESLTREALGYVSIIVGDAVERNHLLSELSS